MAPESLVTERFWLFVQLYALAVINQTNILQVLNYYEILPVSVNIEDWPQVLLDITTMDAPTN